MVNKDEWVLIERIHQEEHRSISRNARLHLQTAIIRSLQRSDLLSEAQAAACIERLESVGSAVK